MKRVIYQLHVKSPSRQEDSGNKEQRKAEQTDGMDRKIGEPIGLTPEIAGQQVNLLD